MEFLTAITSFVSTAAGKAVAGTAIAAASAGGLHAADVVELPVLPDRDAEAVVETDDENTETEATDSEATDSEVTETEATDTETETGTNEGLGVDGATVAEDAQDGGVEGQDIARDAIAGTPAEDRVPAEFGPQDAPAEPRDRSQAPDDAGSQDPSDRGTNPPASENAGGAEEADGGADRTDRGTETPAPRP